MNAVSMEVDRYLSGRMGTGILISGTGALAEAKRAASGLLKVSSEESLGSHPDFLLLSSDGKQLGVDEAQEILSKAQLKPAIAEHIVVLVDGMDAFNVPAQNKLLKLIEEGGAVVIIGVSYGGKILPAIESRMQNISMEPMGFSEYHNYCKEKGFSGDIRAAYHISGGNPDPVDEEILSLFEKVGECLKRSDTKGLLGALHLIKEKDVSSFFSVYRHYVPTLVSYMGRVLSEIPGNDRVLEVLLKEGRRVTSAIYTKDDFFSLIVRVIEGKKEECDG